MQVPQTLIGSCYAPATVEGLTNPGCTSEPHTKPCPCGPSIPQQELSLPHPGETDPVLP